MTGKRIVGIVFLILAVVLFIRGVFTASSGPAIGDPSGLGVSYMVGAFLPAIVVLIIGLWLFQKPKKS